MQDSELSQTKLWWMESNELAPKEALMMKTDLDYEQIFQKQTERLTIKNPLCLTQMETKQEINPEMQAGIELESETRVK
jgi:hypothetical protein